jgi:hypothetical protein
VDSPTRILRAYLSGAEERIIIRIISSPEMAGEEATLTIKIDSKVIEVGEADLASLTTLLTSRRLEIRD